MTAKRLAGLEVVRAACALMVLWSHVYGETLGLPQNVVGAAISSFSLEAVAGFFVLSGCVISLQNYAGIGPYVRSRLVRILPIYYVLLAASTLAMVGCGVAFGAGRLIANATFLQSLFWDPIFPMRFYVPSWSLAYEIYYYLAFIVLLLAPRLLTPLLVASVAVGAAMYAVPYQDGLLNAVLHALAYFSMWLAGVVITRLCRAGHAASIRTGAYMLAVGICLSRVPLSEPAKYDYFRLAGFALGFSFLVWALVSEQIVQPVRRLDLGLPARCAISAVTLLILWTISTSHFDMKASVSALLLFATLSPGLTVRVASLVQRPLQPVLVYVGGLSYALYLVHYPLVQTFNALALFRPIVNVGIVTVLSFGLAYLLDYKFQPWIRVRLGGPRRGPSPVTSAP